MPALPVVFTRRAAREVEAAADWWQVNRPGAPNALAEELASVLILIASAPACGAPAISRRLTGVRRMRFARTHYHLYYRIAAHPPRIEVLAFWHERRSDPSL